MSKKATGFQDDIIAALNRIAPKDEKVLWEVAKTSELVLSQVKYTLLTGIPSFDQLVGGMPIGRVVELFGLESCGKTAMAIRCAAQAQFGRFAEISRDDNEKLVVTPLDPKDCDIAVFYIDNEQSLDEDNKIWFEGQKLDAVGFRCDTADMMFKAIDKVIETAAERVQNYPKKHVFTVIVVDTIASSTTQKEMEQAWGTQDYPRLPLEISNALRRLTRKANRWNVCLLFTNQVRGKFQQAKRGGQQFVISPDDYKSPGGFALRFYASHRVFMWSEAMKYRLMPSARFHAGIKVSFHSMKNRIRMPRRTGKMVLLYDEKKGGFNPELSLLETLIDLDFIEVKAKEKGQDFICKFNKHDIVPTTFDSGQVTSSLDEDDDHPLPRRGSTSRKDPGFKYRAHWPQFYADHKADVDALWNKAVLYAMSTEGLDGVTVVEDEETRRDEVEVDD